MMMIKRLALLLILALPCFAQQQSPQPGDDPIGRILAPPDVIMGHSQELNLQEKQRAAIKAEVQKAQSKFIDAQWDMREETEKMLRLLQQNPVDEAKVLEQADKVMSLERDIKKTQLAMLIRIKNVLTAEQAAKLDAIRKR